MVSTSKGEKLGQGKSWESDDGRLLPWACGMWLLHGKCSLLCPWHSQLILCQPGHLVISHTGLNHCFCWQGRGLACQGVLMENFPGAHIKGRTFSDSGEEKKTTPRVMASKVVRELSLALFCSGSFPVHKVCIHRVGDQGCSNLFQAAEHPKVSFLCRK